MGEFIWCPTVIIWPILRLTADYTDSKRYIKRYIFEWVFFLAYKLSVKCLTSLAHALQMSHCANLIRLAKYYLK